jgi:hypothetical protein
MRTDRPASSMEMPYDLVDHNASRHSLPAGHSQDLATDVSLNWIDLVLARALAANDPDFLALARRRECDEIEKGEVVRIERNGHRSPLLARFPLVGFGLRLVETVCPMRLRERVLNRGVPAPRDTLLL